ncbi:hypothetical protein B0T25DRAFT_518823 [Lasiosphaeria hispida]|uniref:Uncharacterized protein n=1 Tax=Lasiosphaeria hispida TaxID=260671 RepID=A0AAJ0HJG8_9PEZI|nr:hypothetical protein B0T25DRAFT_518823 [Lasiosphaeria hispida]
MATLVMLVTTAVTTYKIASGFGVVRIRSNAIPSYGSWSDLEEPRRTAEVHIPVADRVRLLHESMETENNGTWHRHATYFWDGEESHYLMYRQAHPDDLGHENDGTFHHYRVQDSDAWSTSDGT